MVVDDQTKDCKGMVVDDQTKDCKGMQNIIL
jgi:hypothetical protein